MARNVTPLGFFGWLNRFGRLLGTWISFATFGIGGLVLGTLVIPLFFVFVRDREKRQRFARSLIGGSFSAFVWLMKSLGVLTYEIRGIDFDPDIGNTLIIANHPSLIDVVFLVSFFPQAECVVKRLITRMIFTRSVVTAANYISNDDPETLLSTCIERIRAGRSLVMFPEGTRGDPGEPLNFRLGAAAIAVRANPRILPILIRCEPPTLRKGESWSRIPRTRPHWTFDFPQPMKVSDFIGEGQDERVAIRELQSALLEYYETRLAAGSGTIGG